ADAPETMLPEVQLETRAAALMFLFGFVYPGALDCGRPAPLSDLSDIADVLDAAQTYGVDGVYHAAATSWQIPADHRPVRAYIIAVSRGLRSHAREAAKKTLGSSLDEEYVEEMEDTPALAYHRLLVYHASFRAAAQGSITSQFPDESYGTPISPPTVWTAVRTPIEPCGHQHVGFRSSKSWIRSEVSSACLESRENPTKAAERAVSVLDRSIQAGVWCYHCEMAAQDISRLQEALLSI
ncbi:hypothetical protein BV20DRAFT_908417, partial [Pilatotrama ljubarskyi]